MAPIEDVVVTTSTQIKVDFPAHYLLSENGGSTILNYNLQIFTPEGEWLDLYGGLETDEILSTTHLVSAPLIEKGQSYGFRYRSRNIYYWSEWSPVLTVLAADKPSMPLKPTFVAATANSITLKLYESIDYGGSVVTDYELWMDQGEPNSQFAIVPTYDTAGFEFW